MPPKSDLVYPSLDDFVEVNESVVEKLTVETNEPKNARRENGAPTIEDWVSESKEEDVPKSKTVEMFNKPSFAKINFVKSTEQVKSLRKTSVDKNRQNTPSPRGNKRNWNQQMSQKLGSSFEKFNKACHVCGSFDHLKNDCNNCNFTKKVNTIKGIMVNTARPKAVLSAVKGNKGNVVKASGNPQQDLKNKGVIDSGCSRHMTGNRSYLTDYEKINGGFVAFGGNSKGGKSTRKGKIRTGKLDFKDVYFIKELKFNLFSVSQMCDKKNSVLFTDTECVVLSLDFKLTDESHVFLKVPRKDNMYSVDLKNVVPQGGLTCLFAKATPDESNLWHRRLGHVNFKTMNKLVRGNLVRGLPLKLFEINQTCVACQKGKQYKAYCKTKTVSSISQPLQMLHMDLFGPTFVKSLIKKMYCLVVTDDFSRFSWVFFLATKDETSEIFKTFITGIENLIDLRVKVIRCDNGTKFKNRVMNQFGIKREFGVARTPQQNRAEVVNTACYVQNRVLVIKPHNKTPYELFLGKFDRKADEGLFVGYSTNSKAFRLFDIDALTKSMNYKPVVTGNQSNGNAEDNAVNKNIVYGYEDDPNMPELEDNSILEYNNPIFDEDEDVSVEADMNNLIIGTKWVYMNKKDERGIMVRNKAILVAQGYTQEEGIDYDEVFALAARIEAIRLFLAYALYKDFEALKKRFQRGQIDKTLFIKRVKGDILLVQVYVDDIIFGSTKKVLCTEFEKLMHKKFQMSSMARTPMETSKPLMKDENDEDVDVYLYRSMIGSLMYLTSLGHDIMFDVCACVRFQVTSKVSHLHAVKRIFRYLKGQPKLGLWYTKDSLFDLEAYTDSDYAGASLDMKSTTRGCQFLRSRLISWQCKKQNVVANSTTESEYVAASNCCGQVLWIQNQLLDYGYNFMNTKIFIDNKSTICIVKNLVFHSKTKHIEIRHHFIRDSNEKKLIQMIKIYIDQNVAYLLTKAFDVSRFQYLIASNKLVLPGQVYTDRLPLELQLLHHLNGPIPLVAYETVSKEWDDRMERAATTASSLEADQDSGNINRTQSMATLNEPSPSGTSSGSTHPVETYHTPTGAPSTSQPPILPTSKRTNTHESVVPQPRSPTQSLVVDEAASTGVDVRYGGATTLGKLTLHELMVFLLTYQEGGVLEKTCRQTSLTYGDVIIKLIIEPVSTAGAVVTTASVVVSTAKDKDIQARVEANKELAQRLQEEEREMYTEAEYARMLVELINQRKKYFAAQRAYERRDKL
ncbi:putative ribonuclease H-like domain-containing protein [Tanacetum coccineum]